MPTERFTVAIEQDLLHRFDALLPRRGGANRSEGVRDLIRRRLVEAEVEKGGASAVATLTLIYDHARRELSERLTALGHEHHAHVLASLHIHLDPRLCLEVMALRGRPARLRRFADEVGALKGVNHSQLVLSTARLWKEHHR